MKLHTLYRLFKSECIPEPLTSAKYIFYLTSSNGPRIKGGETKKLTHNTSNSTCDKNVRKIYSMIWRRLERQPIQYILGEWEWDNLNLIVKRPVFIPRPETEDLVHIANNSLRNTFENKRLIGLDLCCGSGAIGISLLKKMDNLERMVSIDASSKACDLTTLK